MKKVISIALALLMVAVMLPVMAMADESTAVAKLTIGETVTYHNSLVDAVANAKNKGTATIDILKSCNGSGVMVKESEPIDLTIDFHGFTYTMDGTTVGSAGTESQAWHIEKGSKLTLKNGRLEATTSLPAWILFQNYCALTLEDMEVNVQKANCDYVMSNNFGSLTVRGNSKIIAADGKNAFDLWYGMHPEYYDGVNVTFENFTGTVVGNIEYGAKTTGATANPGWTNQTSLSIDGGTFTGQLKKGNANDGLNLDEANISITGGSFAFNVLPYADASLVVKDENNNYYVGETAEAVLQSATGGTFTVLNVGRGVAFNDVKPGVTIVNNSRATIIVNGNEVAPEKSYTVPGAPIIIYTPDNEPAILSGANQVVAPGAAATFRIDEEYDRLLAVAVDGVTLDKSNYEAWSGSTYIKLLPKFMKTLSVGTHTLTAYFTSHTVSTTFTISEGAKNPATGANDFVGVAAAMAVVSLLGAAAVIRKK